MTVYKAIVDLPGLRIGDDGSIWSHLTRTGFKDEWRKLSPSPMSVSGYLRTCFKKRTYYVHNLVLEAFVGPRPAGMECRHINGDRKDCRLENLAWGTKLENASDKIRHGTCVRLKGEINPMAKLTCDRVLAIRRECDSGMRRRNDIAQEFGVCVAQVNNIASGRTWRHLLEPSLKSG
jgi:hypothetical protein